MDGVAALGLPMPEKPAEFWGGQLKVFVFIM